MFRMSFWLKICTSLICCSPAASKLLQTQPQTNGHTRVSAFVHTHPIDVNLLWIREHLWRHNLLQGQQHFKTGQVSVPVAVRLERQAVALITVSPSPSLRPPPAVPLSTTAPLWMGTHRVHRHHYYRHRHRHRRISALVSLWREEHSPLQRLVCTGTASPGWKCNILQGSQLQKNTGHGERALSKARLCLFTHV